jgi:hypothetical protein
MKAARRFLVVTLSDFPTVGDFASVTNKSRIKKSISPIAETLPKSCISMISRNFPHAAMHRISGVEESPP